MKTLNMILLLSVLAIWANHFACTHNDNENSVEIKTVPSEEYDFELVEKIKRIENGLLPAIVRLRLIPKDVWLCHTF